MHWKLTLSYDGTAFHGWQVQPDRATVQGTLAAVLHHLTGETVLPQGSGRTDAGVHALAQVTTFSLTAPIPAENLLRALNRALPPSIRVLSAEIVPETFHARHNALRKTYEYRLFYRNRVTYPQVARPLTASSSKGGFGMQAETICPPFLAPYVWDCPWHLSLKPMHEAATLFLGTHDFTSFAAVDPDRSANTPNPVKTLFISQITREDDLLLYRVTGSGFLHHMVRNLVGTLVEIGRGALVPNDLPRILTARDRSAAGPTAPPQGLFLVSVDYGDAA